MSRSLSSPMPLPVAASRVAVVTLAVVSLFGLGGCQAVEAIFKVGVAFGVMVVVVIVAVIGGITAMVVKKR